MWIRSRGSIPLTNEKKFFCFLLFEGRYILTINVPVVFIARYIMVFGGVQHHYEGHWKGWALKIETFLGPEMARAKPSRLIR